MIDTICPEKPPKPCSSQQMKTKTKKHPAKKGKERKEKERK
jgi:hypothetical protein